MCRLDNTHLRDGHFDRVTGVPSVKKFDNYQALMDAAYFKRKYLTTKREKWLNDKGEEVYTRSVKGLPNMKTVGYITAHNFRTFSEVCDIVPDQTDKSWHLQDMVCVNHVFL